MRILHALRSRSVKPLHAFILVCVVVTALVLGIARLFRGDVVPTADVPSVTWEDVAAPLLPEEGQGVVGGEVTDPVEDPIIVDEPTLPSAKNLALPFTSQAPTGNWDVVHEDTCEEASMHMVVEYFNSTPAGTLDTTSADNAMLALVAYEDANGYGYSVSAAELKAIIIDFYDGAYSVDIIEDPSADDLRALVAEGFPVIVPAAGRMLGNPFFTGEGPLYHMLVIRGYEDGGFITNDPGTRHGENYTYTESVLMNAIHDWNNGDPVNGAARVLVMKPAK